MLEVWAKSYGMRAFVLAVCAFSFGCPGRVIIEQNFGEPTVLTMQDGVWAQSTLLRIRTSPGEVGRAGLRVTNAGVGLLKLVSVTRTNGAPVKVESERPANPVFELDVKDASFIEAGRSLEIPVTFRAPGGSDSEAATVELLFSGVFEGESRVAVSIVGAVERTDCLTAMDVDFGRITAGAEQAAVISVSNPSTIEQSATLGPLEGDGAEHFSVVRPAANQVVVAPGSTLTIPVFHRPTAPGTRQVFLTLRANAGCPDVRLSLRGDSVAAPRFEVEPGLTLDFAAVPFFAGRHNLSVQQVTVRNAGLGLLDFRGAPSVQALNPESRADELCLGEVDVTSGACVPEAWWVFGLEANVSRAFPITVAIKDASGPKRWAVKFLTNDLRRPEVQLIVTASPRVVPPCNYRVDPQTLTFGPVVGGTTAVLSANVCNLAPLQSAGDLCLLDSFRIVGDDAAWFAVDPFLLNLTLGPRLCAPIAVKATGAGRSGIRRALLEFAISDPSSSRVQLPVSFSVP